MRQTTSRRDQIRWNIDFVKLDVIARPISKAKMQGSDKIQQ